MILQKIFAPLYIFFLTKNVTTFPFFPKKRNASLLTEKILMPIVSQIFLKLLPFILLSSSYHPLFNPQEEMSKKRIEIKKSDAVIIDKQKRTVQNEIGGIVDEHDDRVIHKRRRTESTDDRVKGIYLNVYYFKK
jgi:hypothetical protein